MRLINLKKSPQNFGLCENCIIGVIYHLLLKIYNVNTFDCVICRAKGYG